MFFDIVPFFVNAIIMVNFTKINFKIAVCDAIIFKCSTFS